MSGAPRSFRACLRSPEEREKKRPLCRLDLGSDRFSFSVLEISAKIPARGSALETKKIFSILYIPVGGVPFVDNKALSSQLRDSKEKLVSNVKRTQVPRVHVKRLNHVFLHELCHVHVFCFVTEKG